MPASTSLAASIFCCTASVKLISRSSNYPISSLRRAARPPTSCCCASLRPLAAGRCARRRRLALLDAGGGALFLDRENFVTVALLAVAYLLRRIAGDEQEIHDFTGRVLAQLVAGLDVVQRAAEAGEIDHRCRLRFKTKHQQQGRSEVELLVDGLAGRSGVQHPLVHELAKRLEAPVVELVALIFEAGENIVHAAAEAL